MFTYKAQAVLQSQRYSIGKRRIKSPNPQERWLIADNTI